MSICNEFNVKGHQFMTPIRKSGFDPPSPSVHMRPHEKDSLPDCIRPPCALSPIRADVINGWPITQKFLKELHKFLKELFILCWDEKLISCYHVRLLVDLHCHEESALPPVACFPLCWITAAEVGLHKNSWLVFKMDPCLAYITWVYLRAITGSNPQSEWLPLLKRRDVEKCDQFQCITC